MRVLRTRRLGKQTFFFSLQIAFLDPVFRVGSKIYVKEREEVPLEAGVGNGVMSFIN